MEDASLIAPFTIFWQAEALRLSDQSVALQLLNLENVFFNEIDLSGNGNCLYDYIYFCLKILC